MNVILVVMGLWFVSDALYSYYLYAHAQSWRGARQTRRRDHWVRAVRLLCAIGLIPEGLL